MVWSDVEWYKVMEGCSGVEWYKLVLWSGLVWCGVLELTKVDFLFSSLDIHSFGIYRDSEKNA